MNITRFLDSESSRKRVQTYWILLVLLWDIAKTIVIDKAFGKFGLNPYYYLAIVMICAVPYALSIARMIYAIYLNRWGQAFLYGIAAVALHFIPDIYVLINAAKAPRHLFDSFIVTAVILTIFAVHGVIAQVRSRRKSDFKQ